MSSGLNRRTVWLTGLAALFALANVVDYFFFGDEAAPPRPVARTTPTPEKRIAEKDPRAAAGQKNSRAAPGQSVQALRQRLEYLRSVAHHSGEIRQAYAKVALPYAEAMASLPTWFGAGRDPKEALERAVRGLAADSGVEVEALVAGTPQRVAPGVYETVATVSVRAGDSNAMLRFLTDAGRPGNGMVWNGFQLSADTQARQLMLAGELRVLLIESAE